MNSLFQTIVYLICNWGNHMKNAQQFYELIFAGLKSQTLKSAIDGHKCMFIWKVWPYTVKYVSNKRLFHWTFSRSAAACTQDRLKPVANIYRNVTSCKMDPSISALRKSSEKLFTVIWNGLLQFRKWSRKKNAQRKLKWTKYIKCISGFKIFEPFFS